MFKRHTSNGLKFLASLIPRSLPRSSLFRCPIDGVRILWVNGHDRQPGFGDAAIHGLPLSASVHALKILPRAAMENICVDRIYDCG